MRLLICLLIICLASCTGNPPKEKTIFVTDTTTVQDTVIFIKDSTMAAEFADSLPIGAYQGMFPCYGCDGMQQTIIFTPDKKYKREELAWGKEEHPFKSEGEWQRKDGKIFLTSKGRPVFGFRMRKDTLFTVEKMAGAKIKDSINYVLVKRSLAANNATWNEKRSQGIDFVGVGNEPFWMLEIDNEKMVLFKLAEWGKPVIVPIEKPQVTADSTVYTLPYNNSLWWVTIYPQFSSDGMSDYLYEYKVVVNFDGQVYKGCGVTLKK